MTPRESDDRIVPLKPEVQSGGVKPGNAGAGKAVGPSRDSELTPAVPSDGTSVPAGLDRITQRAESQPEEVFYKTTFSRHSTTSCDGTRSAD